MLWVSAVSCSGYVLCHVAVCAAAVDPLYHGVGVAGLGLRGGDVAVQQ
jgi:hypothetical protein